MWILRWIRQRVASLPPTLWMDRRKQSNTISRADANRMSCVLFDRGNISALLTSRTELLEERVRGRLGFYSLVRLLLRGTHGTNTTPASRADGSTNTNGKEGANIPGCETLGPVDATGTRDISSLVTVRLAALELFT
jgi:hypothetical protein